jgi:phage replication O-like protein O
MAKGDATRLKADTDDGFARVSNLLLEALCAADLSVSELKTVLFVVRRTYGWARDRDPRYKADTITAQEVATGTGLSLSTVRDALRELRTKRVLLRVAGEPGMACVWGINTDISAWGAESAAWDAFRSRFQGVRSIGVYQYSNTPAAGQDPLGTAHPSCAANRVSPPPHPGYCAANTPPLALPIGCRDQTPRAPGAPEAPTESFTENDSNTLVRIGENDLAARTISPDPVEEKQQQQAAKAKRDADRLRQQTEKLDAALAALSQPDRELLDTMLAGQQIAKGKPLTLLQQATQADIYARELTEHGPECWRDCCRLSCEKQIYTAEYARGCTKHWTPSGGNGNCRGRLPPQGQLTELDRMQLQADYEREEAARRGDQRTTDGTRDPRPAL